MGRLLHHPQWRSPLVVLGLLLSTQLPIGNCDVDAVQVAEPDYTIYHKKEEVAHRVEWIADRNPSTFKVEQIWVGDTNYSTSMQVVTVDPSGIGSSPGDKLRLLLNFGEHGRELVTVEVALKLLEVLSDPSTVESWVLKRKGNPEKMLKLLEQTVFKIVPMENSHGRDLVEAGQFCERKNGRGVDSNRNWPVDWGKKEVDYDPYEEYPGTEPFSEPEVKILDQLAKQFKPHVWVNVHSGMKALFMPYDHIGSLPDDPNGKFSYNLLSKINSLKCDNKCVVGSGGKSVGYLAHGTGTDYMHDILGVPFSFTWEIYGDEEASFQECFKMFNPLTKDKLDQEVESWADAILAMIELLPASSEYSQSGASLTSRKYLPGTTDSSIEKLAFSHSPTDIAAGIRQSRLQEIFAQVDAVNELIGVNIERASWTHPRPAVALCIGGLAMASGLVFFLASRYRRRRTFSLEKSRLASRTL